MNKNCKRIRRGENVVWRIIDDEVVILIPEEATLHALKGCGNRVWQLIETETDVSEITKVICNEFEVEPNLAKSEITDFIKKLEDLKLIEIVSESNKAKINVTN